MEMYWPLKPGQQSTGLNFVKNTALMSDTNKLFYEKSDFLSFPIQLQATKIQSLLPMSLRSTGDAIFFVAQHHSCAFGEGYNEAGLLVKVRTFFGTAYHFLWAVVDSEFGMHLGRDLLGVPKKLAQINVSDNSVNITRKNSVGINFSFEVNEKTTNPDPVLGNRIVNVGGLGQFFLFQPLWTYKSPEKIIRSNNVVASVNELRFDGLDLLLEAPLSLGQKFSSDIYNSRTLLPVGFTGPQWMARNFNLRYR